MTKFKLKCFHCRSEFIISKDEYIPLFNEVKKSEWDKFECPNCHTKNRVARFTKNGNLFIAIEV